MLVRARRRLSRAYDCAAHLLNVCARIRRVIIRAVCRFICPQQLLTALSITPLQMSGHSEADSPVSVSNHSVTEGQAGAGLHINMLKPTSAASQDSVAFSPVVKEHGNFRRSPQIVTCGPV